MKEEVNLPLVEPSTAFTTAVFDSPLQKPKGLEQAFTCLPACSFQHQLVWTPSPRFGCKRRARSAGSQSARMDSNGSDSGTVVSVETGYGHQDSCPPSIEDLIGSVTSSGNATSSASRNQSGAEVRPELLCPTYTGPLQVFDDYEFLEAIGSGAFGKVLRVRHREGGQFRACKAMSTTSPLESELIDTEIAVLRASNHPHVLNLHEVFFEPVSSSCCRKVYLITDLCTGGDLLFRIAYHYQNLKSPMTEGHVCYMLRQILSAARYLHQRGIVHRDIKPANILFVDASACSTLKLIDFGLAGFAEQLREAAIEVSVPRSASLGRLAKLLPKATARWCSVRKLMMQRAGTAYYMAPEMIQVGFYDQKADLFSIGTMLCEMLTGWHPFFIPEADDAKSAQAKITAFKPVKLPEDKFALCSREVQDLCQRLLAKDPKLRLSAEEALAHPWFAVPTMPSPYGNTDTTTISAWVFDALKHYEAFNQLRRAALQVLARDLLEEQVRELRDAFLALDLEGDGLLSASELADAAQRIHYTLGEEEAERLLSALGGWKHGAGYKEFIAAVAAHQVEYSPLQLRHCFNKLSFDSSSTGRISYQHVLRILSTKQKRVVVSEAEWQEIVASCSRPDSHSLMGELTIGFEEFVDLMKAPAKASVACQSTLLPELYVKAVDSCSTSDGGLYMRFWLRCSEPLCC